MTEKIAQQDNHYQNEVAFKELLKMMRRKDILTICFVLDKYGYESISIESKIVDEFVLQLSNDMLGLMFKYLLYGEIADPLPSPTKDLVKGNDKDTNELSTDLLRRFVVNPLDQPYMHIVPAVVDRPDRLTVTFGYPFGVIVFKVKRTKELEEFLTSKGY